MKNSVLKTDSNLQPEASHVYLGSNPTLSSYFRQIAKSTLLTVDEEKSLMNMYFDNMEIVRNNIYTIGFVADEHIKLIDRLFIWNIDEFFVTSVKNRSNESVNHIFASLKEWKHDIAEVAEKLRYAFKEKKDNSLSELRIELKAVLYRHMVLSEVVEEWFNDARDYVDFLNEKEDASHFSDSKPSMFDFMKFSSSDKKTTFIEEKVLMPESDFVNLINETGLLKAAAEQGTSKNCGK